MTTRTRHGWPASARWPLLTRSGVSDSSGPVAAEAALGAAMSRTTRGRPRRTCRAKVVRLGTCMARKCTYAGSSRPKGWPFGAQPAGAGAGVHRARTVSPTSEMSPSAHAKSTGICQLQCWETPKANELFMQCSAMPG